MSSWRPVYHSSMTDPPPVREDWAERTARGTTGTRRDAYRCPEPGCPVRYAGGSDRPCPDHDPAAPEAPAIASTVRRGSAALLARLGLDDRPEDPPDPDPDVR